MRLITLHQTVSASDFVQYWNQLYDYGNEEVYNTVITKEELLPDDILKIYQWKNNIGKNNDRMSSDKLDFVKRIGNKIAVVNRLRRSFSVQEFQNEFKDLSAIWGILLLHIINPSYPIFDKHVYRAYRYIRRLEPKDISSSNPRKYKIYFEEYVPFFRSFYGDTSGFSRKEVDSALWAFGKFLSRYPIHHRIPDGRLILPAMTLF